MCRSGSVRTGEALPGAAESGIRQSRFASHHLMIPEESVVRSGQLFNLLTDHPQGPVLADLQNAEAGRRSKSRILCHLGPLKLN